MGLIDSDSSWIIALGKTVLNSMWIGLLVLSLLKAQLILIPQRFSEIRYYASLLSLLIFTALTTALFLHIYSPPETGSIALSGGSLMQKALPNGGTALTRGDSIIYQIISLIYFAGMGIYLLISLLTMGNIHSQRRGAESITGQWYQLFSELKTGAGISRKVDFLVSEQASGPFLTGMLKPAIIVPTAMLSQLSFREVEAILMHELYHLKRLDHVVNLLQRIVEILFFFNPAVWLLSRIIRSEREKRCDDLVIGQHSRPLDYARALYTLSLQMNGPVYGATAATGSGKGELTKRIERILKPNTMKTNMREKINALLLFTCGILIVLLVSGFSSGFSITRHLDVPVEVKPDLENPKSPEPIDYPETPAELSLLASMPPPALPDTLTKEEKEQIRKEVKEAIEEVRSEINWDEIKAEIEDVRLSAMEDIDWDQIKKDMEEAKINALESIPWDEFKEEMEEIDWEQMKMDMTDFQVRIDSMFTDFDFDLDMDDNLDIDVDVDVDVDVDLDSNK